MSVSLLINVWQQFHGYSIRKINIRNLMKILLNSYPNLSPKSRCYYDAASYTIYLIVMSPGAELMCKISWNLILY